MSYVVAAWASCGAIVGLYSWWALRRERLLRRSLDEGGGA